MRHIIVLISGVAAVAIASPANAQQASNARSAISNEITDGDAIIVTGEKANRTLQETTSSVAVITPARVEQENIQTIQDVYNRTANVSETYGASGFSIRGIRNTGVGGGGNADTATVYVDGAPIPRWALYAGPTDLWDIGQVEILRGPQSTIQGLNALAGAVVINTRDPSTSHWTVDGRILWSDHNDRTFSVAAGGPLIEDELGIRLSAERRADRGVIRNVTIGGYDDTERSLNLRGKVKWTPSALPDLTAVLSYNRVRREGGYVFEYARTDVDDYFDNRISQSNQPSEGRVHSDIAVLNLGYHLSDNLTLSSVTSWNQVTVHSVLDSDAGPEDLQVIDNKTDYKTLTQELRLNLDTDRVSGLLGAWYYRRTGALEQNSRINIPTPVSTITALLQGGGFPADAASSIAGDYANVLPEIPVLYVADQPQRVETAALFGDVRYHLTGRLALLAGFRYDHERNRYEAETTATFTGTLPDPLDFAPAGNPVNAAVVAINQGVLGLVSSASSPRAANRRSFDAFLPKAGISMDWTPGLTTALTVQRAYRSGGSSQNPARAALVPYDPEYSWNYELSLRSTWLDGRLTFNANAFYMDWRDQQTNVQFGLNAYDYNTVNAARSHLYGFEIESSLRLSRILDLYASAGHVHTKFDDFELPEGTTSTTDLDGTEFPYAPHWTLAGGVNARFGNGFVANLNANYRSSVYTDIGVTAQARGKVSGRTAVNGRLGYELSRWTAFVFAKNLLGEEFIQYENPSAPLAILGEPQTFGAGAELHF